MGKLTVSPDTFTIVREGVTTIIQVSEIDKLEVFVEGIHGRFRFGNATMEQGGLNYFNIHRGEDSELFTFFLSEQTAPGLRRLIAEWKKRRVPLHITSTAGIGSGF